MAVASSGVADVICYYGTAASCVKYRLHPQDWQAAKQAPDAALWALSAQSGTVVDKSVAVAALQMGDPGLTVAGQYSAKGEYLEPSLAVNTPSWGRKYPGPT
jgi:hypothetical protein